MRWYWLREDVRLLKLLRAEADQLCVLHVTKRDDTYTTYDAFLHDTNLMFLSVYEGRTEFRNR